MKDLSRVKPTARLICVKSLIDLHEGIFREHFLLGPNSISGYPLSSSLTLIYRPLANCQYLVALHFDQLNILLIHKQIISLVMKNFLPKEA